MLYWKETRSLVTARPNTLLVSWQTIFTLTRILNWIRLNGCNLSLINLVSNCNLYFSWFWTKLSKSRDRYLHRFETEKLNPAHTLLFKNPITTTTLPTLRPNPNLTQCYSLVISSSKTMQKSRDTILRPPKWTVHFLAASFFVYENYSYKECT